MTVVLQPKVENTMQYVSRRRAGHKMFPFDANMRKSSKMIIRACNVTKFGNYGGCGAEWAGYNKGLVASCCTENERKDAFSTWRAGPHGGGPAVGLLPYLAQTRPRHWLPGRRRPGIRDDGTRPVHGPVRHHGVRPRTEPVSDADQRGPCGRTDLREQPDQRHALLIHSDRDDDGGADPESGDVDTAHHLKGERHRMRLGRRLLDRPVS